jgi:hypothetical protein
MKGIEIGICPFLSHCTVMLLLRLFEPIGAIRLEKRLPSIINNHFKE